MLLKFRWRREEFTPSTVDSFRRIITHSGSAHRDDFLSVCLLLTKYPEAVVERRAPVSAGEVGELDIVVDVGGRYEPGRWYDHHQDIELPCSLLLVLKDEFGIERVPPDVEWIDRADRWGPNTARKTMGFKSGGGVLEKLVLTIFSEATVIDSSHPLHSVMRSFGGELLEYLRRWGSLARIRIINMGGAEAVLDGAAVNLYIHGPYAIAFTAGDYGVSELVEVVKGFELVGVVSKNEREPYKTSVVSVDNNPHFRPENIRSFGRSFLHPTGFMAVLDIPFETALKNYDRIVSEALTDGRRFLEPPNTYQLRDGG
jgi:hypothetical protein